LVMKKKLFSVAKSWLGPLLVQLGFAPPLSKILPVKKVYEDAKVLAFYHPKPFWEIHIVIVPKMKISVLDTAREEDFAIMGHICRVASEIVRKLKLDSKGYRLVTNGGKYQKVKYLHFHLGAGKQIQIDEGSSRHSIPDH